MIGLILRAGVKSQSEFSRVSNDCGNNCVKSLERVTHTHCFLKYEGNSKMCCGFILEDYFN